MQAFTLPEHQTVMEEKDNGADAVYHHPAMCALLLRQLLTLNGAARLDAVPLSRDIKLSDRTTLRAGEPLGASLTAITETSFGDESIVACDAFTAVLDSLIAWDKGHVLVAMDQVNALYSVTGYRGQKGQPLFVKAIPELYKLRELMSGVVKLVRLSRVGLFIGLNLFSFT